MTQQEFAVFNKCLRNNRIRHLKSKKALLRFDLTHWEHMVKIANHPDTKTLHGHWIRTIKVKIAFLEDLIKGEINGE